jgi:conjugative transfer signal peptidase TraF
VNNPPSKPRPLPLFAWFEERREQLARRRRLRRHATLVVLGIAVLASTIVAPPLPQLVWNKSASAPLGLYRVLPGTLPQRDDMVVARLPQEARDLAARRHYLPSNVPMIKHVAGLPGDVICGSGTSITLNGEAVAQRLKRDRKGRVLPHWQGCFRLTGSGYFLLNAPAVSFDGRYFGASDRRDIIGRAVLLWAR